MSAYLINPDHIGEMSKFFRPSVPMSSDDSVGHAYNLVTRREISFSSPLDVAEILALENVKSIKAKYPDNWKSFFSWSPEGEGFDESIISLYVSQCQARSSGRPMVNSKDLYGMIHCYEYQSCEGEDHVSSDAYWLTHALKGKLARKLIGEPTVWEYRKKEVA